MTPEPTLRASARPHVLVDPPRHHDAAREADALTDLFLGDTGPLAVITPRTDVVPISDVRNTGPANPRLHATPRLHTRGGTRSEREPGRPSSGEHRPEIELVVLGHLPLMASAWASQYVRAVSNQLQAPVGFVRAAGGNVWVELVGDPERSGGIAPNATDLDTALSSIAGKVERLIVRVDETLEPDAAAAAAVRRITLLTGADEAAVVGLYRAIKGLHECGALEQSGAVRESGADASHSAHASQVDCAREGVQLGVCVLGADAERGERALERIRKAVRAFLSTELSSTQVVPKITPGSSRAIFRGSFDGDAAGLITRLHAVEPAAIRWQEKIERPAPSARPPEPAVSAPKSSADRIDAGAATSVPHSAPGVVRIASLIRGLTPVELTCPVATGVEWAIDEHSGLAAVARAHDDAAAGVEELLAAAGWASLNRGLIARVLPQARSIERPTLHLVCDRPRSARHLLDAPVRVHAFAPPADRGVVLELN